MKISTGAQYLSLLDLMCCGMGGGVLLLLIMAAAQPLQAKPSPLVVVRCHVSEGDSARAELGIRYREPGSEQWIRIDPRRPQVGQPAAFSARSESGAGGELVLALVNPKPGMWRFQPFLVDFPAGHHGAEPIAVTLQAIGQEAVVQGTVSLLQQPGDFGEPWTVTLGNEPQ